MSCSRLLTAVAIVWVAWAGLGGARGQHKAAIDVPPAPPATEILPANAPPAAGEPKPAVAPVGPGGRQEPALSLEWIGPTGLRLGQPAQFQIVVRNVCPAPVQQVVVRHRLAEGVSSPSSDPLALAQDRLLTWELGTLQPGQEKHIRLQLVAAAKAVLDLNAQVTFTGSAGLRVQVREPRLALKLSVPEKVVLGDQATVTLTVSNPGDGLAEHVKIKALLPEGLEHPRGRQIDVDLGPLAAREQRTLQLVCAAHSQGVQRCEATAAAEGGLEAKDAAPVEVVLPRIELTMSGPHLRYLDRHATYVITVTNPGSAAAGNVTIQAPVPKAFKFHAATGGGQLDFATGIVTWFVGDLPPGQSREVSLELSAVSAGEHHLRASVTAARGLRGEAEALTRVEGLSALLMELADADDPVEVGADTSYEIRVTNTGSKMETNLELVCTLPERMELRGAKCSAGCHYRAEGRDVIFAPLPRLAPKADVVYHVQVRGTAPGDLRFRARIRADGLTQPVLREESTKVYGDDLTPH
jgi:uncharacterized repeat protein (TIGR01451 family)